MTTSWYVPNIVWKEGFIFAQFCTKIESLTKWPLFFLKTKGSTERSPSFLKSSPNDPLFFFCPHLKTPFFSFVCHRKTPILGFLSAHPRHFHMWVPPGLVVSTHCHWWRSVGPPGETQCWSESGLGLGLNGWVRVRVRTRVRTRTLVLWTRTRTRTPPLWSRTQGLWTRTLVLWTRTRTRTLPRWTRTHSESRWVRWEMYKANLNFHVQ